MNAFTKVATDIPVAPMIVRGQVIAENLIEVGGRGGDLTFLTPDASKYLDQLPLGNPSKLSDLYKLSFEDILDYLAELGEHLKIDRNPHLRQARDLCYLTAPTTPPIIDATFASLHTYFDREVIRENAEHHIGVKYLEGWVSETMRNGQRVDVRCFGARCVHIIAGNSPAISAMTIIRNAVMRSDAIIKAPSNDPFTALAIARTMCDMAPDHPITKHLTVAYWRGGSLDLEEKLYQPRNVEKIVAWGGFASVKHVSRYIQPGLELISFDPKLSASIVGAEAFESEAMMRAAAIRIATDVGALNQVACVNARVIYALSGTDEDGLQKLDRLGDYVYEAMLALPPTVSTKPKRVDRELKTHINALRLDDEWYRVIGGEDDEGAVIVSHLSEPVDFSSKLADRTANLVPVDRIEQVVAAITSYTQTVGVFPESLKDDLVDLLALYGAQRFVSLGYAIAQSQTSPQDGIEPMRRMGKWVTNEICSPETVAPPWMSRP